MDRINVKEPRLLSYLEFKGKFNIEGKNLEDGAKQ